MLKRNSIIKFILLAIIAILGVLLCVCPFSVPYSADVYNGFIPAINKGVDLNGGMTAIYQASLSDNTTEGLSDAIDSSLVKIQSMFETEKFSELSVRRQGGNKVYVLASGKYANQLNDSFDLFADAKPLSFTLSKVEDNSNSEVIVDSSVVYKAYADYNYESESYGVRIEFTKEGIEEIKELKSFAEDSSVDKVYLYLGELTSTNTLAEVEVDDLGEKTLFITASSTGSYSTSSATDAREIAYSIVGGSLDVELKLLEVSKISPILGKNSNLLLSISLGTIVLLSYILLVVKYRHLGLLAILALTFNLVLFSFFMMALPFITLNLAGVIGSLCGYFLSVFAVIMLFEKIKEEYAMGKKIHLSCKGGFKKALWPILDSHIITIIISLFMWIFAPGMIKGFAVAMILSALLSAFTSLVIMRGLIKNYLKINSTKPKKMALYRDKTDKEIKDEEVEIIKEDVATFSVEGGSHE